MHAIFERSTGLVEWFSAHARRGVGLLGVGGIALAACTAQAGSHSSFEITGGANDYVEKPMYTLWEGDPIAEDEAVCLESDGQRIPGQVEHRADGTVRIWFLADVEAGQTREYEVQVGEGCADASFSWEAGDESDRLRHNGATVLRYVKPEYDEPASEWSYRDGDIKKPTHHAYSPDGERRITKGPYGRFEHHQGIYFGYNQISWDGGSGDTWHGSGAYQQHVETLNQWAGPVFGGNEVRIDWTDDDGEVFIVETRRVKAFKQSDGNYAVDFESTLESQVGDVVLDGDNHHAGVQFRASQYVADNSGPSRFLRPEPWAHLGSDEEHAGQRDMPWNTFQFVVEDQPYSVAYLTNPQNPEGRKHEMSERLYGRFGEWIPTTLSEAEPLNFRYRLWISDKRDELQREQVDAHYEAYTGRTVDNPFEPEAFEEDGQSFDAAAARPYGALQVANNHSGFGGQGFADFQEDGAEAHLVWEIEVPEAGTYELVVRYANNDSNRPLHLTVNDTVVQEALAFESTGDWSQWQEVSASVELVEGENAIGLKQFAGRGPNVDGIRLSRQ